MTIGSNLKKYRRQRGLTLHVLADAVKTSKSYIWEMEDDRSVPGVIKAYELAKALGVRIEDLIGKRHLGAVPSKVQKAGPGGRRTEG